MSETTNSQVTIYYTSWCAFCHTEMQWLDKLGVNYDKKNIEEDDAAKDEMLKKLDGDFQGVPVTDVGGEIVLGFDRPKLQDALEAAGLIK